jgi:hypothetical protein
MKTKTFFTALLTTLLLALALAGGTARAAGITWNTPVTISADTDVSTVGALIAAVNVNDNQL